MLSICLKVALPISNPSYSYLHIIHHKRKRKTDTTLSTTLATLPILQFFQIRPGEAKNVFTDELTILDSAHSPRPLLDETGLR